MADSKITDLPLSPFVLDRDLMVVVTGNLNEGSYPQSCRIPLSHIRRYITRLDLLLNSSSGITQFYNSGLNTLQIGLNIVDGEGIGHTIGDIWPHSYEMFITERVKNGSTTTIANNNTIDQNIAKFNIVNLSYNDFYQSKTNQTLSLLGTACFKISSINFADRPFVPGQGLMNSQKSSELLAISGSTINYNYTTCISGITTNHTGSVTLNYHELSNFVPDNTYDYIAESFTLNIGISGEGSSNLISNIHSYPITFTNSLIGGSRPYYNTKQETYRPNTNPYLINSIDPMIIQAKVNLTLNSNIANQYNSLALCAFITNVRATRTYTNLIDINPTQNCDATLSPSYSYSTNRCYCTTNAVIDAKFLKGEHIIS